MFQILILTISYVLGSIPFGFITARIVKGIDIRKFGSGNIGATNVSRVVGLKWGVLVFTLDFMKGMLPIAVMIKLHPEYSSYFYIAVALAAVAGHNWSIFLLFKGGKGVATSIGVLFGLCFKYHSLIVPVSITVAVWGVVFLIYKKVSLASITAAFAFFAASLFLLESEFKIAASVIFILIVMRHKKNIMNLLNKEEL